MNEMNAWVSLSHTHYTMSCHSFLPPRPFIRLELRSGSKPLSHLAGTKNFHAITPLNWRSYSAMAVIELGQEIKAARQR
jgi:membrane-bound lytic murein transglycosylase B